MKKALAVCVAVGLLGGALIAPADAAKKKRKAKRTQRVAEATYANPALGVPGVVGSGAAGGSAEFPLGPTESFIKVQITDDGGGSVTFTMSQNTDPSDDSYEIIGTFCGKTDGAVQVTPGLPVRVSVYTTPGVGQPSCMGPATSGTIKATISNLP